MPERSFRRVRRTKIDRSGLRARPPVARSSGRLDCGGLQVQGSVGRVLGEGRGGGVRGETGWGPETGVVWYWYDFLCPFSYVGHDRPGILRRHGLEVIELPLQLHPEVSPGGVAVSALDDATHE